MERIPPADAGFPSGSSLTMTPPPRLSKDLGANACRPIPKFALCDFLGVKSAHSIQSRRCVAWLRY
jgi:hypothetical protein